MCADQTTSSPSGHGAPELRCQNCGQQHSSEDTFCGSCGESIHAAPPVAEVGSAVRTRPAAKILIGIVAFAILVGGGILVYSSFFAGADGSVASARAVAGKLSVIDSPPTPIPDPDRESIRRSEPDPSPTLREQPQRFATGGSTGDNTARPSKVEASHPQPIGTAAEPERETAEVLTKTGPPLSDRPRGEVSRQEQDRSGTPQSQPKELLPPVAKPDNSEPKVLVIEPGGTTVRLPEDKAIKSTRPVYAGPREGVLLWRGSVAKNGEIVIQGNQVNSGSLTGELPGVPCILTLSDPRIAIAEAPGPSNSFRKIVLRSPRKRSNIVLTINWQVLN